MALGLLRVDAPERKPYRIGVLPDLSTSELREAALQDVVGGVLAPTTALAQDAKWGTIVKMLSKFGYSPFPPTVDKILAVGAALKAGSYRSAPGYFSVYRTTSVRQGRPFDQALSQSVRDMSRSCFRGLGGPLRARALPFNLFAGLPADHPPWVAGGPAGPRNLLVAGVFWMLREAEVSATRAALVQVFIAADGLPRARWHLPASKSDTEVLGVARSHGCACGSLPGTRGVGPAAVPQGAAPGQMGGQCS